MSARHRISKLLLRHGHVFDGPGETWSQRHLVWLGRVRFSQPLTEAVMGEYLGHHPASSTEAIAHLESLRARGAEYLLVPATSGWWLEHYGELAAHLERDHELVASEDGFLVCFALREPAGVEAKV